MSVVATIAEKAVEWAYKHLGAMQVCWLCALATLAIGWLVTTKYAPAAELSVLRAEFAEIKADTIAKRIFDYRVRQCDTPPQQRVEKRWLAEQLRVDAQKFQAITGQKFEMPACSDL